MRRAVNIRNPSMAMGARQKIRFEKGALGEVGTTKRSTLKARIDENNHDVSSISFMNRTTKPKIRPICKIMSYVLVRIPLEGTCIDQRY